MAYHDEYVDLISAAMDGTLSPADRAKLEAHLAGCPDCQALYDDLVDIQQTLQALPSAGAPAGLTDRVMAAVRADNVTPITVKKPAFQWKRWAATAAILALILAGAGGLGLLSGREVMGPPTGETPTPEAIDPAMARTLPVPTQGETAPIAVPSLSPEEAPASYQDSRFPPLLVMPVPSDPVTGDSREDEVPEDPEIGVMSVGLEPGMTEEALAALEQLRLYLGLPEGFEWEDAVTCLWADEETTLRLTYLGLDSGGLCHMFDCSKTSILYLVPVDGGEIITAQS